MKTTSVLLVLLLLCSSCMSGKQRYRLYSERMKLEAGQARVYQPLVTKGKTTITADDGIAIMVPIEQLGLTSIPDDYSTTLDFAKFATGVGGAIIGVKELNKTRTNKTIINNNPEPAAGP